MAASLRTMAILLVIAETLFCSGDVVMVSAQTRCGGNLTDLISQCYQYVRTPGPNIPPSAACCAEVTKFDVKCACDLITQEIASVVNIPKAVFVARSCGLNLPAGTKCGAITIPPARR